MNSMLRALLIGARSSAERELIVSMTRGLMITEVSIFEKISNCCPSGDHGRFISYGNTKINPPMGNINAHVIKGVLKMVSLQLIWTEVWDFFAYFAIALTCILNFFYEICLLACI